MKRVFIIFFLSIISLGTIFGENIDIWGKWNWDIGDETIVDYYITINDKVYVAIAHYNTLTFRNDYYGDGPRISYNGGHYKVERIENINDKLVLLYVTTGYYTTVKGKISMHFIDPDHMWLEIDRNDPATDEDFPGADFRGSGTVFWRKLKSENEK